VLHKNIPAVLSTVTTCLSEQRINIENMTNKSRGDAAYTIIDVTGSADAISREKLAEIDGVIRVRILQ
jgi:D-3-phosphoglycerate dehydrogenase